MELDEELRQIVAAFNGGKKDDAIARLNTYVQANPDSTVAFAILFEFYQAKGEMEKAVEKQLAQIERAGEADPDAIDQMREQAFGLCMEVGGIRADQAEHGSGYKRKGRSYSFGPTHTASEAEEEAWKAQKLQLAVAAYTQAAAIAPQQEGPRVLLAKAGNVAAALNIYTQAHAANPDSPKWQFRLAEALHKQGSVADAQAHVVQLLAAHPSFAPTYKLAIELFKGDPERVAQLEKQGKFYAWLPEWCRAVTAFTPQLYAIMEQIESKTALAAVKQLAEDATPAATDMLAAICYHHYHGEVENAAFKALAAKAATQPAAGELLVTLIRAHQSLCTVRGALAALAAIKHPKTFDLAAQLLPQDRNFFSMDVPNALATLGDPRAAPLLIKVAGLGNGAAKETGPGEGDSDSDDDLDCGELLRDKCIMALGTLKDHPSVLPALLASLEDASIAEPVACSLYLATGDRKYLDLLRPKFLDASISYFVSSFLQEHQPTEEIKELVATAERVKKEKEEERRHLEELGVEEAAVSEAELKKARETGCLNLAHKLTRKLPAVVCTLSELRELELCDNRLTHVPTELASLTQLVKLNLQANRLSGELDSNIGLLQTLTYLHFHGNRLEALPDTISRLRNLGDLGVSCNKLTTVPPSIGFLPCLKELSLDRNALRTIPPEIGLLTSLVSLALSSNKLTRLPTQLSQLTNLQTLMLYWLTRFTKLTLLNVSDNPIKTIPVGLNTIAKTFAYDKERLAASGATLGNRHHGPVVPSLHELAARAVVRHSLPLGGLQPDTRALIHSAHRCDQCGGPFFDSFVECVVDASVPLAKYLCRRH